jgi:glucosamine-phosphate N-acetyltransferase
MKIRPIIRADYVSYMALINTFRKSTISRDKFEEIIVKIKEYGDIWVLTHDNKMVACSTIFFEHKIIHDGSLVAHIEDVVVDASCRGMGYGKLLLNHLKEISSNYGAYKVVLNCTENTQKFYEKSGFLQKNLQMEYRI